LIVKRARFLLRGDSELVMGLATSEVEEEASIVIVLLLCGEGSRKRR
jgi:hypothetical protein